MNKCRNSNFILEYEYYLYWSHLFLAKCVLPIVVESGVPNKVNSVILFGASSNSKT